MLHPSLIERITRSLAYMLRHQPEQFDLVVDEYGFADLDDVVSALNERLGEPVETEDVSQAVEGGDRPRYEIREGRIRALYGHSIQVKPGEATKPPDVLYVGISKDDADRARRYGLRPGRRSFLHLALTPEDALETGRRTSRDYVVIKVNAVDAWEEGINFYDRKSLYLSGPIPTHFLEVGDVRTDGYGEEEGGDRGPRGRRPDDRRDERPRGGFDERPRGEPAPPPRRREWRDRPVEPAEPRTESRPLEPAARAEPERREQEVPRREPEGDRRGPRGRDQRRGRGGEGRHEHRPERREPAIQDRGGPERPEPARQEPAGHAHSGPEHAGRREDRGHGRPDREHRHESREGRGPHRGPPRERQGERQGERPAEGFGRPPRPAAGEPPRAPAAAETQKPAARGSSADSFGLGIFEPTPKKAPAEARPAEARPAEARPAEARSAEARSSEVRSPEPAPRERPRAEEPPREPARSEPEDSGFGAGI